MKILDMKHFAAQAASFLAAQAMVIMGATPGGSKTVGAGTIRRRAREAAKREWQKKYYADLPPGSYTRQQDRAAMRDSRKALRVERKIAAMKGNLKGGAAIVR